MPGLNFSDKEVGFSSNQKRHKTGFIDVLLKVWDGSVLGGEGIVAGPAFDGKALGLAAYCPHLVQLAVAEVFFLVNYNIRKLKFCPACAVYHWEKDHIICRDCRNTRERKRRVAKKKTPKDTFLNKEPTNESSERIVSLPPFLLDLLREYKKEQAEARMKINDIWQGSDRIFTTWDGSPMHPDSVTSWFPAFLERHGLPHLNFHGLRHTAATMAINEGVPLKNISGRFGHANVGTTADIYGHFLRSADKVTAEKLEGVYQRIKGRGKRDTKKGRA